MARLMRQCGGAHSAIRRSTGAAQGPEPQNAYAANPFLKPPQARDNTR
jgi:hypothetical protein